jgi:predicted MFS family arabinose efflux permease
MMPVNRWVGVLVLLTIISISYVDRINISVMITDSDFLQTFGLQGDRIGQGRLTTAFLIGYGISAWFLTPLYEAKWTVRAGLAVSIALWVLFTGASALATGVMTLLAVRVLLGVAEGPLFSLKAMYVKEHFAANEVGKPNAVSSFGVNIGLAAGYSVVVFLIGQFGWRDSFWALAALNLGIGVPLILLFVPPERTPAGAVNAPRPATPALLRSALGTPHIASILLIEIATLGYLWGASTWLPAYLREAKHFSLSEMSFFAGLPFATSLLAQFAGGAVLDRLPRSSAPILFVGGGLGTSAAVTASILIDDPYTSALAFVLAGALWGVQTPAIPTLVQHLARTGTVGSTYGLVNGVGNIVSALMPMLMGAAMVSKSAENLAQGFWLLVGSQLLAAVSGTALLLQLRQRKEFAESPAQAMN